MVFVRKLTYLEKHAVLLLETCISRHIGPFYRTIKVHSQSFYEKSVHMKNKLKEILLPTVAISDSFKLPSVSLRTCNPSPCRPLKWYTTILMTIVVCMVKGPGDSGEW